MKKYAIHIMYILMGTIQLLLGIRFLLKIFDLEPTSTFVSIVYILSEPLILPLKPFFESTDLHGIFFIDLATLFGMIFYTFLGYFIIRALSKRKYRRRKG